MSTTASAILNCDKAGENLSQKDKTGPSINVNGLEAENTGLIITDIKRSRIREPNQLENTERR